MQEDLTKKAGGKSSEVNNIKFNFRKANPFNQAKICGLA